MKVELEGIIHEYNTARECRNGQVHITLRGSSDEIDKKLFELMSTDVYMKITFEYELGIEDCLICGGTEVVMTKAHSGRFCAFCPKCDTDIYLTADSYEQAIHLYNEGAHTDGYTKGVRK